MRRDEHGVSTVEWGAMMLVVAAAVGVIVATGSVGTEIRDAIKGAICEVFQGESCYSPSSSTVARPRPDRGDAGGGGDGDPVTAFFGGGLDRVANTVRSAGCMVGLCGGAPLRTGWQNAAAAVTPSSEQRFDCAEWGPAEGARATRPDGSPRQRTQIGTFNMYGNKGHGGETDPIVPAIVRSVNDRQPTFLALNEVCQSQATALDEQLDGYRVYFAPIERVDDQGQRGGVTCRNGSPYGNAVLYREDFADDIQVHDYDLGTPDREGAHEKRGTACVSSASKGTTFCSVHLTSEGGEEGDEARKAETGNLRDILARDHRGQTILVGGDFNAPPDSDALDNMYDERYGGGANGDFKEVDSTSGSYSCRGGEKTHGEVRVGPFTFGGDKIDYIFTTNDVEIHDTDATHSDDSDHDPLWSDVTF